MTSEKYFDENHLNFNEWLVWRATQNVTEPWSHHQTKTEEKEKPPSPAQREEECDIDPRELFRYQLLTGAFA
jgi:hypothetical protein